jgi:5,10-methylenetetrahydromethanopterin reductase
MNDKLGVRWGFAGGTTLATIDAARDVARYADRAGFDGLWISHAMAVDPIVALACVADDAPNLTELGTSVVPLYGRHPIGLAQLARTAQSALGGRFTLGIGAASAQNVQENMGMAWDRPFSFTREFVDGLQPLLAGQAADVVGEQLTTRTQLLIDAPDTPILLAALGPKMLEFAGQRTAGTSVGQCGPKTVAGYVAPKINAAAAEAGQPAPRIMALIRICVTDDLARVQKMARDLATWYRAIPSYRAVQDMEGLDDLAGLFLVGSWEQILDGLGAYAESGVTDFRLEAVAPDDAARDATLDALASYLTSSGSRSSER